MLNVPSFLRTRLASNVMAMIHNDGVNKHRMPAFMQPIMALDWIKEGLNDEDIIHFLSYGIPQSNWKPGRFA